MADSKPDIVKSPIIMKVDGPTEDNQDNEENERTAEKLTACSPAPVPRKSILSSSKLGNPFGVNNLRPLSGGSILKAPVLNSAVASPKAPFTLNPSKLSFGGSVGTSSDSGDAGVLKGAVTSSSTSGTSSTNGAISGYSMQAPKFVPLLADTTTGQKESGGKAIISTTTSSTSTSTLNTANNTSTSSRTATSGFIFGQNLKERVIGDPHITTSTVPNSTRPTSSSSSISTSSVVVSSSNGIAGLNAGDSPSPPATSSAHEQHNAVATTSKMDDSPAADLGEGCSSGSGSSGSLFSTVIRERELEQREGASMASADVSSTSGKSLSESAREWEEQRANKRKYEEVEVRTGEEGETNVAQVSCKLFAWADGSWAERGRGILRLNDREVVDEATGVAYQQSRLVFRSSGSLRVILNTKIWTGMEVKEASPKSLMVTAADSAARLYLLSAAQDDVRMLYRLVTTRVRADALRTQSNNNVPTATPSSSEVAPTAAATSSDLSSDTTAKTVSVEADVCTSSSQEAEELTEEAE